MIKKSTWRVLAVAAIVSLAPAACGDNLLGPNPEDIEFAASLGINLASMTQTASGLYYLDVTVGDGATAAAGDIALVSQTGFLADGTEFGTGPFQFVIEPGGAIAGFVEGVTGMRVGGQRVLVIPSSLGYGSEGIQGIPKNAVLIFDVTLDSITTP